MDDCRIVLDLSDDMTMPEEDQEIVIVRRTPQQPFISFQSRGVLTRVWASPSGRLWAAGLLNGSYGVFSGVPDAAGNDHLAPVHLPDPPTPVDGVFGTSDDDVFAWGGGRIHAPVTWHFDGDMWRAAEAPGRILDVHGPTPELVYAVGEAGLVARWIGDGWRRYEAPGTSTIRRVHVADDERMFACGGTSAYAGSVLGWVHQADHTSALHDVAVWNEMAIFATSNDIVRLDGPGFVTLAAERPATQLEASGSRVLGRDTDRIFDTDFSRFRYVAGTELSRVTGALPTLIKRP